VKPHGTAVLECPHLDEIADPVGDPQSATPGLGRVGAPASGERVRDPTAVAYLADHSLLVAPQPQGAFAACVNQTVRRDLVRREHEIGGSIVGEPRLDGVIGDPSADLTQRVCIELHRRRSQRRLAERFAKGQRERLDAGESCAVAVVAVLLQVGMVAPRLLDDLARKGIGVIRTQQRECGVGEGDVKQRFMAFAFREFGGTALGPDRLADPTQAMIGTRLACDEVLPRRNDARRIRADIRHVGEHHFVAGVAEPLL
jgi:hypothetical protein